MPLTDKISSSKLIAPNTNKKFNMEVAELLYHTTLTIVDNNADTSGNIRKMYILGTHANLEAAKQFAAKGLHSLGYEPEDFAIFEGHQPGHHWRHGDGVVVFAKSWDGQKLLVGLLTTPNNERLRARPNGTIEMPQGTNHLHYVLQSKVDYNQDRSGAAQETEIEGCYLRREEAIKAARECLSQSREEFDQYDERQNLGSAEDVCPTPATIN